MEELRAQAMEVLATLSEEQLLRGVAYAQCVKDGDRPIPVDGLLEEERV